MKKEICTQKENVMKLLELIQENPELRIIPVVETECVPSDDWSCWLAQFGKAYIDEIYVMDERVYIRSCDEDTLIDGVITSTDWEGLFTDSEITEMAKTIVASYKWEKVILVEINPN